MKETIDTIKNLRKRFGVTQRQLALSIHKSSRDISLIENHTMSMSIETGLCIIAFLKSKIDHDSLVDLTHTFLLDVLDYFRSALNLFDDGEGLEKFHIRNCIITLYLMAEFNNVEATKIITDFQKQLLLNKLDSLKPSEYRKLSVNLLAKN